MSELKEGEEKTLRLSFKTESGNPARYDEGSVSWESSDESIVSVTQNPENELEATVKGLDGTNNEGVVITARADGDPDDDETRDIVATKDYVCTQGEAFVAELEEVPTGDEASGAAIEETEASGNGSSETETEVV